MTTSGVDTLEVPASEIIEEAYDLLQVAADGESIDGDLSNRALKSLNRMLKHWQTQGIHLWTMTEGSLFLSVDQPKYDFRLEGRFTVDTHLTNDFTDSQQTTTTAAITAAVDLKVTLASVATLSVGDQLGIIGDDLDLDWYLVMEIVGNLVTLDQLVQSTAATAAVVYHYPYLNTTVLTANELTAATVLDVASTANFIVGNTVLVLLDDDTTDGPLTITAVDDGLLQITVTPGLTSAASIGNSVLNLDSKRQPFKFVKRILNDTVRRREDTDYEIPIVFQSRKDYFDLPNKNQPGTPIQAYYDRQRPQGVMYIWNKPDRSLPIINFTYERGIEIVTQTTQIIDFPESYYDAIVYNLAWRMIPKVGCSAARQAQIKADATEYLNDALAFDQAVYGIRLKPMKYG